MAPTFVSFQRFYPGRKTGGDISAAACHIVYCPKCHLGMITSPLVLASYPFLIRYIVFTMCRFSSPPLCHVRETSGSRYFSSHTRRFSLVSVQSWRIEKRRFSTPCRSNSRGYFPALHPAWHPPSSVSRDSILDTKTGSDISATAFFLPFQVDYIHR